MARVECLPPDTELKLSAEKKNKNRKDPFTTPSKVMKCLGINME
jgi:hypothetical protein